MYQLILFFVYPWSILLWMNRYKYSKRKFLSSWMLLSILFFLTVLYNYSINAIINIVGIGLLFSVQKYSTIGDKKQKRMTTLIIFYIIAGLVVSTVMKVFTGMRYGLFGGEPNFSGFTLIFLLIFLRSQSAITGFMLKLFICISVCMFLYLSASRTFLSMSLLTYVLYLFRDYKVIILLILLLSFVVFFNLNSCIIFLEDLGVFQKSGYVSDYKRLVYFSDPSSIERIKILDDYTAYMVNHPEELFLGFNDVMFTHNSHNSYIQVIQRSGVFFLALQLFWMMSRGNVWKYVVFLFYGLFLHNVLSIPYLILLKLYERDV